MTFSVIGLSCTLNSFVFLNCKCTVVLQLSCYYLTYDWTDIFVSEKDEYQVVYMEKKDPNLNLDMFLHYGDCSLCYILQFNMSLF